MDTSTRAAFDAGVPRADAPGTRAACAVAGLPLLANAEGARVALDAIARVQRQIVASGTARVHADEAARRRLARELHDSVGAELAATRFALANVHTWLPADAPPQCTEALALVMHSLDCAGDAVRRVLDGLYAPELDAGLAAALASWTRGFASRTGLAARFTSRSIPSSTPRSTTGSPAAPRTSGFSRDDEARLARLPAEAALALFRVAQEALTNVARHAQATRVEVCLTSSPRELIVSVIDDGVGLSREAARRAKRQWGQAAPNGERNANGRSAYGIAGMRERCAAFGGTLRTASARDALSASQNPRADEPACDTPIEATSDAQTRRAAADPARPGTTVEARFLWDALLSRPCAEPAPNLVKGVRS
ncbi:sensor histidine kinase [Paraburkholderia oxyphila]|uniref:sensor histidine kinase n=1 Tax=Paraburkholderia oxyphila TaxID=614212 RepID=UPI0005BDE80C|nr:ATP-binding protein [Paraburkholderia oxyphila]